MLRCEEVEGKKEGGMVGTAVLGTLGVGYGIVYSNMAAWMEERLKRGAKCII